MANTLRITATGEITLRLPRGSIAGWRWDGAKLIHTSKHYLRFTPEKSAEIASAVVLARIPVTECKSGAEVAALLESERPEIAFVAADVVEQR